MLTKANEIWLKLEELHDGSSNILEQKYCLIKQTYDSFAMQPNELVKYIIHVFLFEYNCQWS